jgi:cytochrome c biogenesis protein CcdA/thiol-disulfide isomerase/thioredoxin
VIALMAFAFVAGAATALSPCVLPVLPVALSAGVTGGRRRPLGVVTGLALSFAFATVALVYVIDALGLPGDLLRNLAIVVLLGFGISLLVPAVSARIEAWVSRIAPAPKAGAGDGFGSGLLLGASLGFVYAPCAGPILAGVITVSASQSFTAGRLAVALSYAAGSAVVLYFLLLGGRKLIARLAPQAGRLQMATGAVMVIVALLMAGDYDTRFQTAIASDLPAVLVNPTKDLEEGEDVREELTDLRSIHSGIGSHAPSGGERKGGKLPVLGVAPEFADTGQWFNTPGDRSLTLRGLRGRVVLIDFWTYTCINCIRTLPYVTAWDRRYRDEGLTVVGVHTPEFPFEREAGNVADAIDQNGIEYPVAQDNEYGTWEAWGNQYWPAKYLIDTKGRVRYAHFGEGEYGETEAAIRELLAEAGHEPGARAKAKAEVPAAGTTTPESYLGAGRALRFANGSIAAGTQDFEAPSAPLGDDELAYDGRWRISFDAATALAGARLDLNFGARRVFLVLGSRGGQPRPLRVLLDGKPLPQRYAGTDVEDGVATISDQRLYRLVELPSAQRHLLSLEFAPGISGYAFTFG